MDGFHTPQLKDKEWVTDIVSNSSVLNCDAPFGTNYVWSKTYGTQICHYDNFLLTIYNFDDGMLYCDFPIGQAGDIKAAVNYMLKYAAAKGLTPSVTCSGTEQKQQMEQLFGNKFICESIRDNAEYIYLSEDLAFLRGRKLHGKRNHINKFNEVYNWSYEEINPNNYAQALDVAKQWCAAHGVHGKEGLSSESCAIKASFKHYEELGFYGGLLKIDGKAAAMTVGEEINKDCFVVHFEKALDGYDGLYAAINNQFSKRLTKYKYLNREEDMGIEGLRKAKLSYRPAILLEKNSFTLAQG